MRERGLAARAKWRGLISEQGASGQSVALFCRERGLCAPQFFSWKKRLRAGEETRFLEAVVEQRSDLSVSATSARCLGIEVVLPGGYRLLVEPGFEASHLRALLQVLESGS